MSWQGIKFDRHQTWQLLALSVGAALCLTPLATAAAINSLKKNDTTPNIVSTSDAILIAQETTVCPEESGGSQFVSAETRRFLIYICGGDEPNTYVGMAKNGGNGITLPLQSYTRDRFVAVNANTSYTLTRTELIVRQNGRVILRERATWKR
ncbi:MAG TPA: hypothetical protein V6D28_23070 [Leptolyngbyaceae cyanobacterium]